MMIKELFYDNINRPIETVIKADDRDHISDEVTEYVVTNEIAQKIRDFFQAYNDYAGANGVWISGFFGSGKSHLLKILSYVLENKTFNGNNSGEVFADKIEDDEMLRGDVLAATRIPSESVLFNIDQQAQITSKSDENAILSVFYKVFYDHLGYYGYQPHVAEFEMWLDKQGIYDQFKIYFESKAGKPWIQARMDYFDPLVTDTAAEVLGKINNTEASKYETILDSLEDKQKQSIEDFCLRVQNYIESKPKGFRLNFFVDEVGQYISDNTKLMLNLQTIAETLATRTKGNSWILVTSQEDMEKVVGDMTRNQQNDFSRIQARFKLKIPLTSANVDEVIEKRLLKKKEDAQNLLSKVFLKDNAHLNTLLSFSEAGIQFKGFRDEQDFANKYPFVAYQFDLFQNCRRALSAHNAFQGKHASVGERSMLGVFQQVIKNISERDENALVSFDKMYEGIRNELRGEIQSAIILAERNLDNRFAVQVLKALFLVKYFGNFKTTKRNISVLMIDDIHVDLKAHEQKITEALNILENQNYVQRNGDIYEFLTDDEKDVEQEIKATEVDDQAITNLLKEIFYGEIIQDNKIAFLDNKQNYEFTSKIDGTILGREKELEIEIITENNPNYGLNDILQSQTMGSPGMKMQLQSDAIFMKDVRMYLKTEKYVKQNHSTTNRPEVNRILQEKAQQNRERRRNLVLTGNKLLAGSDVFMNGRKHEMGATAEGKTRVVNAFQDLIKLVYPSLRMLGSIIYSEDTIKQVVRGHQDDLFEADDSSMSEAEAEILNFVNRRKKQSERTVLTDLKGNFSKKPYGWYPNAIWTIAAKLYKRGKIEIRQDSNLLEDESVINAMLNTARHPNTILEPQASFNTEAINALKQVYAEAFNESCPGKEAKDTATFFKQKLNEMSVEVNQLLARKREYPFLESLEDYSETLERLSQKEYSYYLTQHKSFEDDLLNFKEDLLDPVKRFMNGDQIHIYDSIRKLLNGDTSNLEYIEGDELITLREVLLHKKPYSGSLMRHAKVAKETLTKKVLERINEEKSKAIEAVEKAISTLKDHEEFQNLYEAQQNKLLQPLEEQINKLRAQKYIANIRDIRQNISEGFLQKQLNQMVQMAAPPVDSKQPDTVNETIPHYIRKDMVKVDFPKTELRTEEDVDEYIKAYKKTLIEQIKNNKRISLY